jgi:hypothetical protein
MSSDDDGNLLDRRSVQSIRSVGKADDNIDSGRAGSQEDMMIRRNLVVERDQKVVKWSLIAAAFALSLGYFAEVQLERHVEDTRPVAGQTVDTVAPVTAAITG